MTNLDYVND